MDEALVFEPLLIPVTPPRTSELLCVTKAPKPIAPELFILLEPRLAFVPRMVLLLPAELSIPAEAPTKRFEFSVVFLKPADAPTNEFELPVLLSRPAKPPTIVFEAPKLSCRRHGFRKTNYCYRLDSAARPQSRKTNSNCQSYS